MKKAIAFLLALVMGLSLCACGGNKAPETGIPAETPAETTQIPATESISATPTDEWYIHNADNWEGTFNNTVASKAKLGAKLIADGEHISLFLYEYGSQQVKNFSSVYENKYNIAIRTADGTQVNLTGTLYASGDRIFIDEAYTNAVLDILLGDGTVQFYLEEANRPGTNYLFAVDCSNFAELYQSIQ